MSFKLGNINSNMSIGINSIIKPGFIYVGLLNYNFNYEKYVKNLISYPTVDLSIIENHIISIAKVNTCNIDYIPDTYVNYIGGVEKGIKLRFLLKVYFNNFDNIKQEEVSTSGIVVYSFDYNSVISICRFYNFYKINIKNGSFLENDYCFYGFSYNELFKTMKHCLITENGNINYIQTLENYQLLDDSKKKELNQISKVMSL